MFSKGEKVDKSTLKDAMTAFIDFLPANCILVAHNANSFDSRILLLHLMDSDLMDSLKEKAIGFLDTLPLAKDVYPGRRGNGGYSQPVLVRDILKTSYDAHNAIADVAALFDLLKMMKTKVDGGVYESHTISLSAAVSRLQHKIVKRQNLETLEAFDTKVISKNLLERAASSGLKLCHFKLAASRGIDAMQKLLTEKTVENKPRVTASASKVRVTNIIDYINSKFL